MSKCKCSGCEIIAIATNSTDVGRPHNGCPANGRWERIVGEIVAGTIGMNEIDLYLMAECGNYKIQHSDVQMLQEATGTLIKRKWVGLPVTGEIANQEDIPNPRSQFYSGWIVGGTVQLTSLIPFRRLDS